MTIYSWFFHEKLWFSIAMLVYQRVWNTRMSSQCSEDSYGRLWTLLDQGKCRAVLILRSSYWSLYMRYHKLLKIMRSGLEQVATCIQHTNGVSVEKRAMVYHERTLSSPLSAFPQNVPLRTLKKSVHGVCHHGSSIYPTWQSQFGFVWKCWVNIPNEIAI